MRTLAIDDVPFRVLSLPVVGSVVTPREGRPSIVALQVVEDRSAEQAVLDLIVEVLVIGGVAAVIFASMAGGLYSRRAMVPISDALAGQRQALRRQRDFAADVSHELRTPLTILRASAEDLRAHADEPVGSVGMALRDIEVEVASITSLVDDLLLLARSDSGVLDMESEPVELGDVAAEASAAMAATAERLGVTMETDPEPVMVIGDWGRLRQLVTILVDNGVRHSVHGGVVRVRVRQQGPDAVLTVDDQGLGIAPEDLPHVFDRFWRGRSQQREGTGLGLAIASSIVTRHGGTITAANRATGGARFTVQLPASPSGSAAAVTDVADPGTHPPTID